MTSRNENPRGGSSPETPSLLSKRGAQIVTTLRDRGDMAVFELADALGVSRSVASTAVEELVQLGVVERRLDRHDRRRRIVSLRAAAARLPADGGSDP